MFPLPRLSWDPSEEAGLNVLVPGLMGMGFLISLAVLAADLAGQLVPVVGRRRAAEIERRAMGRAQDVQALLSGRPPSRVLVHRQPRRRGTALVLASLATFAAVLSLMAADAIAGPVGPERQAWAITGGVAIAVQVGFFGAIWFAVGILGPRMPSWLRAFNRFWPLGAYPDPARRDQR